ncbi:MAG TPA: hypothetical protein VOB72_25630, partial [Candidatus Dormibacteraeota bacterium]|nr:hypothetical protein [Candidatus Dormibacteraeota bacterium]
MTVQASLVPPFDWLRVVARTGWRCAGCGTEAADDVPVLVDWFDRAGAERQRRLARGLVCRRCGAVEALGVPLLQYRRSDAVGLLVGLPAHSAGTDDRTMIGAALAAARSLRQLDGADAVAPVRLAWWESVWNMPLGPRLTGCLPLVLPESDDETRAWRQATVAALSLPDVPAALNEYISADSRDAGMRVLERHPELVSARWRLTVETRIAQLRAAQVDSDAVRAIDNGAALLRQVSLLGAERVATTAAAGGLPASVAAAMETGDHDARLAALRAMVDGRPVSSPLTVAAHLALVQALHGARGRRAQDDAELVTAARRAVAMAADTLG